MDPGGGMHPPPPDPRLLKGMPKIHALFVEYDFKMSKITRYPLPPEISGSTPARAPGKPVYRGGTGPPKNIAEKPTNLDTINIAAKVLS